MTQPKHPTASEHRNRTAQSDVETGDTPLSPQAGIENPEADDYERSETDAPSDDPGDAQRSSKTEPDGDGEEEFR